MCGGEAEDDFSFSGGIDGCDVSVSHSPAALRLLTQEQQSQQLGEQCSDTTNAYCDIWKSVKEMWKVVEDSPTKRDVYHQKIGSVHRQLLAEFQGLGQDVSCETGTFHLGTINQDKARVTKRARYGYEGK